MCYKAGISSFSMVQRFFVYVVKETKSFREDKTWIDRFGKRLYMQYQEENSYYPSDIENIYGWLIQFDDGNRLDLHVETITHMKSHIYNDTLCVILFDKDNILPLIPEATDKAYWVKKPTEQDNVPAMNFGGVLTMLQRDYGEKRYHM